MMNVTEEECHADSNDIIMIVTQIQKAGTIINLYFISSEQNRKAPCANNLSQIDLEAEKFKVQSRMKSATGWCLLL